jgi:hypothetical protein
MVQASFSQQDNNSDNISVITSSESKKPLPTKAKVLDALELICQYVEPMNTPSA